MRRILNFKEKYGGIKGGQKLSNAKLKNKKYYTLFSIKCKNARKIKAIIRVCKAVLVFFIILFACFVLKSWTYSKREKQEKTIKKYNERKEIKEKRVMKYE